MSDAGPRSPLEVLGPGLVTGAADDDPSGIATYSQVGAQFGYALSWTMLFSFPLMAAIQEVAARIGCVTGAGIAKNLRRHYPSWLLRGVVTLLVVANVINLGADLGAMGAAFALIASLGVHDKKADDELFLKCLPKIRAAATAAEAPTGTRRRRRDGPTPSRWPAPRSWARCT